MKIYAPNKNATGTYASVRFLDGVAEKDYLSPHLMKWFRDNGYRIETDAVKTPKPIDELTYADLEAMTPYDLKEFMVSQGYKVGSVRNKGKLLEIVRGGLDGNN